MKKATDKLGSCAKKWISIRHSFTEGLDRSLRIKKLWREDGFGGLNEDIY